MNRLRELRKKRGINMREAAAQLNIPYTTYVNYEKGDREPNLKMLITLANFFSVSVDYLLGKSDDIIDDRILDIVNTIDNDILENSGGNLLKAMQEQKERDEKDIAKIMSVFNEDEKLLLSKYEKLNQPGKTKTHDYIDDLLDNDKYIAPIKQTIAAHGADETEGTDQPPIPENIL